jgi:hypothetical protein
MRYGGTLTLRTTLVESTLCKVHAHARTTDPITTPRTILIQLTTDPTDY